MSQFDQTAGVQTPDQRTDSAPPPAWVGALLCEIQNLAQACRGTLLAASSAEQYRDNLHEAALQLVLRIGSLAERGEMLTGPRVDAETLRKIDHLWLELSPALREAFGHGEVQ